MRPNLTQAEGVALGVGECGVWADLLDNHLVLIRKYC